MLILFFGLVDPLPKSEILGTSKIRGLFNQGSDLGNYIHLQILAKSHDPPSIFLNLALLHIAKS